MLHPTLESAVAKVESGYFDGQLETLEGTSLGIALNCCLTDGVLSPMPPGFSQQESGLTISVSDQLDPDAIQVGWFGSSGMLCSSHSGCNGSDHSSFCSSHSSCNGSNHGFDDGFGFPAQELNPYSAAAEVAHRRELLDLLRSEGLGLALIHAHSARYAFTELPLGYVSVIENGQTSFRPRHEVLAGGGFLPTAWRLEDGVRQPVGGFIVPRGSSN